MATRRNALALLDAQVRNFQDSKLGAVEAWEEIPKGAERDARELLSGPVSTAQLRRLGHPFARPRHTASFNPRARARNQQGRGRGSVPRLPINKQSGRLISALDRKKLSQMGTVASQTVGFDRARAGNSLYVLSPTGTTKMVARGFWSEIKKRSRTRNLAYRQAFRNRQRQAFSN